MEAISGLVGSCLRVTISTLVVGFAAVLSGVLSTQTCSPHTVTGQHNVHAYNEQLGQRLSGCVSAVAPMATDKACEFHVINLRSSSPSLAPSTMPPSGAGAHPSNLVDLLFKPKLPGIFSRSLVLVLNSPTPTHWRLEGKGMFSLPVYTITVVVPEHSCRSVTYDSEISLAVRLACSPLPQNNSDLIRFVQEQYGSVTSFNEVAYANSLTLLVGSDIITPTICQLQPNFPTDDFIAEHILEQPITGCSPQEQPDPIQPEFHIVILRKPVGTDDAVTVELRPTGSCDTTCDIILVVVSEANVTWRITGGQRSGTLQVLSPNDVDPRRGMLVENRELPRNAADLMAWAGTQQWPLGSFSSANTANKFVVIIGIPDNKSAATKEPPSRLSFIKQYTEKECHRDFIQVRILRRIMDVFQLTADNMMLRDPTCRAIESGDYYIINTQRNQCGTTVTDMDTGQTVYHNEAIFSNSESLLEGSGGSDLEKLMGGAPVDDEQTSTARVPFTCTYDTNGDVLPDNSFSRFGPLMLSVDMYTGNQFAQKQLVFPHSLQAGERVYFEVALTDGQRLSIVPSQCWLSTGLTMLTPQLHMLIYKSCARDESLIFHRDVPHSGRAVRFSFEVPDLQWNNMYYMHCELGICSDEGTGVSSGIPLCADIMDPETGCLVVNKHNDLVVDFPTKSLYLGPLKTLPSFSVLLNNEKIDPGYEQSQVLKEPNGDCEAVGLATGPAAAIALASFVMGLVLMGALWFIHTHTGHHTGPPPSASPCTVSTASSPSANGHLMNGHIPNGAVPNGVVSNGVVPNGSLPRGFMASTLNPNRIPLQGMRHVDPLPQEV